MCETWISSVCAACLRLYRAKVRPTCCIPPHPLLCHETFPFFWRVFQSSSHLDFDLHPFQLLICSMLVIVLVFPADVQLDNAFTPLEATALETLSFLSSLLLRLFGVGLFINLPATGVSRVPRPLLVQRFLWSRHQLVPGGVHHATLHIILCYIKRVV